MCKRAECFASLGGESFAEHATRSRSTLERLAAKHPRQTIVVVSHGRDQAAVTYAQGVPLDSSSERSI